MIASLTGQVQKLYSDKVIVSVGGVGYEVFLSTDALARMPETGGDVFLYIHTHVREDAFVLFGFPEEEEKELYLTLTTVSGVGPKVALGMLSGMVVTELCRAIGEADVKRLTTLKGIGKKTAERICVELKDKVSHLSGGGEELTIAVPITTSAGGSIVMDAISALCNLGYNDPIARDALTKVKKQIGDEAFASLSVEEMIREGLKALA